MGATLIELTSNDRAAAVATVAVEVGEVVGHV